MVAVMFFILATLKSENKISKHKDEETGINRLFLLKM